MRFTFKGRSCSSCAAVASHFRGGQRSTCRGQTTASVFDDSIGKVQPVQRIVEMEEAFGNCPFGVAE
jgi:hypothetical protein